MTPVRGWPEMLSRARRLSCRWPKNNAEGKIGLMKWTSVVPPFVRLLFFVCVAAAIDAAEPAEKIRDVSPDGKFAVRIRYDGAPSAEQIPSETVHAVEIVTLPDKKPVEQLLGERAGGFSLEGFKLVWSPDSKAFAFSVDDVRTSVVATEELHEGKFVPANEPEELQVDVKNAFTQYVHPVRWVKPGELLLEEVAGFRDYERAHTMLQLTAKKDAATGKYKIVSHKRAPAAKRK